MFINEHNRDGGGILLGKQSLQRGRRWHRHVPVWEISGARDRQNVYASKKHWWQKSDFYSMEQTLKHSFSFKMLEEKSVKFYMNDGLTEIKGESGKVALMLLLKCLPQTYCVPTV